MDTETTGIDRKKERLLEVACIEVVDRKTTGLQLHQYINPEQEVGEGAFRVHGISWEKVKHEPVFAEVADKIIEISDFQFNIHALVSLCYKDQVNQEQFSEEIYFKLYKILKVNDKFELNNKLSSIQEKIINYFNTIIHL